VRGGEAVLEAIRALLQLSDDFATRIDDVLALRSDALLVRRTTSGTLRVSGGAFERNLLMLWVFGADGLLTRWEQFDTEREAEALARFDELAAEPPATARITNAATRSWDRFREAWEARDWERVAAIHAPGFRQSDRRTMMHLELDRDAYLQSMRGIFEMSSSRFTANVLATRGERLLLSRAHFEGTDRSIGSSEVDLLSVIEVDDAGDRVAMVTLDPDDLDGAYAELDRRYAAGEAAPYARTWETLQRFAAAGDWDELASVFDPDLVLEDHRPIGWGTLHSRDEYLAMIRALVDLAPDLSLRLEHVLALDDRRTLGVGRAAGSWEGGPFEMPFVAVVVLGPDGRIQRFHQYDLDQLDAARARFEGIRVGAARDPFAALARPNAASAVGDRLRAALATRDWAAMRALCAPGAKFEDRGRRALVSGDVDWWIADLQGIASMRNTRFERQLVGTAGDRVALDRVLLSGDPGGAAAAAATESQPISSLGPFELEAPWVTEVDESGRITAGVAFDVDDWRAATREAWARWFARDAVAAASVGPVFESIEALNDRDRTRLRAALADDFVLDDHRPARLGLIEGADAWADSWAALWDLAPDTQIAIGSPLAYARYGSVGLSRTFGTLRDGGTFENPTVMVAIVADGRIARLEAFEPEHVDAALARFAELRPDPLRIPPNAATRAGDRLREISEARDWDAYGASCATGFVFDDRRRFILLTGDRDMFIANGRHIASVGWFTTSHTLLATAGDRLALEHFRWTGAPGAPDAEIEVLLVREVDAEGRLVAIIAFDPDDRRAASAELSERYVRSNAVRGIPAAQFEMGRALHEHDLGRCRAALASDFVLHDHRRMINVGRLESADAYIASLAALFEQSSDVTFEILYIIAAEKHGALGVGRTFGTLADGGGEFELLYVLLTRYQGDRYVGMELFELEDLDVARARFEELRPKASSSVSS
jgi:ketosteroid isomerase-like protein